MNKLIKLLTLGTVLPLSLNSLNLVSVSYSSDNSKLTSDHIKLRDKQKLTQFVKDVKSYANELGYEHDYQILGEKETIGKILLRSDAQELMMNCAKFVGDFCANTTAGDDISDENKKILTLMLVRISIGSSFDYSECADQMLKAIDIWKKVQSGQKNFKLDDLNSFKKGIGYLSGAVVQQMLVNIQQGRYSPSIEDNYRDACNTITKMLCEYKKDANLYYIDVENKENEYNYLVESDLVYYTVQSVFGKFKSDRTKFFNKEQVEGNRKTRICKEYFMENAIKSAKKLLENKSYDQNKPYFKILKRGVRYCEFLQTAVNDENLENACKSMNNGGIDIDRPFGGICEHEEYKNLSPNPINEDSKKEEFKYFSKKLDISGNAKVKLAAVNKVMGENINDFISLDQVEQIVKLNESAEINGPQVGTFFKNAVKSLKSMNEWWQVGVMNCIYSAVSSMMVCKLVNFKNMDELVKYCNKYYKYAELPTIFLAGMDKNTLLTYISDFDKKMNFALGSDLNKEFSKNYWELKKRDAIDLLNEKNKIRVGDYMTLNDIRRVVNGLNQHEMNQIVGISSTQLRSYVGTWKNILNPSKTEVPTYERIKSNGEVVPIKVPDGLTMAEIFEFEFNMNNYCIANSLDKVTDPGKTKLSTEIPEIVSDEKDKRICSYITHLYSHIEQILNFEQTLGIAGLYNEGKEKIEPVLQKLNDNFVFSKNSFIMSEINDMTIESVEESFVDILNLTFYGMLRNMPKNVDSYHSYEKISGRSRLKRLVSGALQTRLDDVDSNLAKTFQNDETSEVLTNLIETYLTYILDLEKDFTKKTLGWGPNRIKLPDSGCLDTFQGEYCCYEGGKAQIKKLTVGTWLEYVNDGNNSSKDEEYACLALKSNGAHIITNKTNSKTKIIDDAVSSRFGKLGNKIDESKHKIEDKTIEDPKSTKKIRCINAYYDIK